jgi:hypothetical protein
MSPLVLTGIVFSTAVLVAFVATIASRTNAVPPLT